MVQAVAVNYKISEIAQSFEMYWKRGFNNHIFNARWIATFSANNTRILGMPVTSLQSVDQWDWHLVQATENSEWRNSG
jgi:hypothetical protein